MTDALLAAGAAALLLARPALRRHHAEAGRGDHQPAAHRDAEGHRRRVRGGQPRHQGRDHLAALGPGVREVRDHGLGRRDPRRGRDARHAGWRSTPTTACSRASSPTSRSGTQTGELNDRALEFGRVRQRHRLHAPLRLLSAGDVLQQEAVQGGRRRRAAEDAWTSSARPPRRSPSCPASTATACAAARAASTAG